MCVTFFEESRGSDDSWISRLTSIDESVALFVTETPSWLLLEAYFRGKIRRVESRECGEERGTTRRQRMLPSGAAEARVLASARPMLVISGDKDQRGSR